MRFILEVLILELSHDRKEEPYDYILCAYKRLLNIALADNAKTNKIIISYDILTKYYFNYSIYRNE